MKFALALLFSFAVLLPPSWAQAQCDDSDLDNDSFSCRAGDCNDLDNTVYPGAPELCDGKDNNCDTINDNPPDGDGDGVNLCQGDCADNNPNRFPGNPEICDGVDNDCNAGTPDSAITRACYTGPAGTNNRGICHGGTEACSAPTGWSGVCAGQQLPQTELCDNIDQDCDGNNNNGIPDADGDGSYVCFDCDDNNPNRRPGLTEVCDGVDNDCNNATLDSSFTRSCYTGPAGTLNVGICRGGTETCNGPSGWSGMCVGQQLPQTEICDNIDQDCNGNNTNGAPDVDGDGSPSCFDCDDNNPNRRPGLPEICDGIDNDCNTGTLDSAITRGCYTGPGGTQNVGLCRGGTETCNAPGGWSGTCVGQILPTAELCDAPDQDCNGQGYNGFPNADGDPVPACAGDCDDNNPNRYPGRAETCDGIDNDCNPATLDSNITRSCYTGPAGTNNRGLCRGGTETCNAPGGWSGMCVGQITPVPEICDAPDQDCNGNGYNGFDVDGDGVATCQGDCNDNNPNIYPGRTEICNGVDDDCDTIVDENFNADGDGFTTCQGDCNDNNPNIYPGAPELCNNIDEDCDTDVDNGFADVDGDGYAICRDCNDNNAQIRPGAPEVCNGADDDCDTLTDERDAQGNLLRQSCYTGPGGTLGIGMCVAGLQECIGGMFTGNPCVGQVVPSAEICDQRDNNCNNQTDEGFDADGDSYVACGPNADCNDNNPMINPGATEVCNGADDDCDTRTDERDNQGNPLRRSCYSGPANTNGVGICQGGLQTCTGGTYNGVPCVGEVIPASMEICDQRDDDCDGDVDEAFDVDGDGFSSCGPNPDCADNDPTRFPGNPEVCDGKDNDCDGNTDENNQGQPLTQSCYTGPTGTEGVGICQPGVFQCQGAAGFGTTCVGEVLPMPTEICNNVDDNCNNQIDEGSDTDGDGYTTCAGDCDDNDPARHPGAIDICNNIDDDCDTTVDGNLTPCYTGPVGTATVGTCQVGEAVCINGVPGSCANEVTPVAEVCDELDNDCDGDTDEDFDVDGDGVSTCGGDCNDNSAFVAPGLEERCDCTDNDCDLEEDEDGFGGSVCDFGACHDFDADGYSNCDGDCNDRNPTAAPGLPELYGDGLDNDCDGDTDEDVDEDGDGVTTAQGDCDDRFASVSPAAVEVCDGFDNNCDGDVDEGFDEDGDFATVCAGDCDDNDPMKGPFRREVCGNNIDDDCDGLTDPDLDIDGDSFTTCGGDCNDQNGAVYPGAPEVCDGQDNDCNNRVDEGFDEDNDRFATCFGDCDDNNPNVHPFAREQVNTFDDNCNGQTDEGQDDNDGDGFSYLCGDCNDANASVNPHATDLCDRRDNDCDGRIDQTPQGESTCATCNDTDRDGVTDCDGDCDDANPAISPRVTEVCDGIDNDCDLTADLEPGTGVNLCTAVDAGPVDASGGDSGGDGGGADAGVDAGVDSGEPGELDEVAPVAVKCGCSSTGGSAGGLGGLAALLVGAWWARRRSTRGLYTLVVVATLSGNSACTRFQVGDQDPTQLDAGLTDSGELPDLGVDGGSTDRGPPADVGFIDVGPIDSGPLTEGPCRLQNSDQVSAIEMPGAVFVLAVHEGTLASELSGASGFALDDDRLGMRGFSIRIPLDPSIDPLSNTAASQVIDQYLDPLFDQPLPGVTGLPDRVDETLRQTFKNDRNPAARSLREISMVNDVLPSRIRTGLLSELAAVPLTELGGVPVAMGEAPTRTLLLATYVEVDVVNLGVNIILAIVDDNSAPQASELAIRLNDLTNGTHIGPPGSEVAVDCENKTAEALLVDFIWVVDNSASMQEEQAALAQAAEQFFGALQRSRIDFRIGVVTTDGEALQGGSFSSDIGDFRSRVRVGINGNGREQGLEYALRAVDRAATASVTEERLRPDAVTVVIFYTDEESLNLRSIDDYITEYLDRSVLAFAIAGPRPRGCTAVGRGIARVGESYIRAAEATGGTTASICAQDLTGPIEEILIASAGAASVVPLMNEPISGSLEVAVPTSTMARDRRDGFDYEPGSNSILFFGVSAPPVGDDYRVSYLKFRPFMP
jgi:hypothetical protein